MSCILLTIKEAHRQLHNTVAYCPLTYDRSSKHNTEITKVLHRLQATGQITEQCMDFLIHPEPRTPQFYLLPKIYKNIHPPPGRPIISGNGGPTEKISKLVDHFLRPYVQELPSYIKDTTHFLQMIDQLEPLPTGSLLCTLDVCSLYTSIPIIEAIQAVALLFKEERSPNIKPTNQALINLLALGLKRNNFAFNGQNFLQIRGVAMGNPFAPSVANIKMGQFEQKYIFSYMNIS